MAIKGYNFTTPAVKVVTPEAKTLFMSLAEVNEYTGNYGGKLVFTPEQLEQEVSYTSIGSPKDKAPFKDVLNDLVDAAFKEYITESGKKATKVYKVAPSKDAEGEDNGLFEVATKNQQQPRIQNTDKTVEKDYSTLVANGSTIKASLYLKPYVMQGKVGITAYLNGVLLIDVIEYGAKDDMFDDEDFGVEAEDALEF